MLEGMMKELEALGLSFSELDASFGDVLVHLGVDGAASCELVVDFVRELSREYPSIIMMNHSFCLMHSLNRVVADHVQKSELFDLNGVFQFIKMLHVGNYFGAFVNAVVDVACENPAWTQFGDPTEQHLQEQQHLIELCYPGVHSKPQRHSQLLDGFSVINGNLRGTRVPHICSRNPTTGAPCCRNIADVQSKIRAAIVLLLVTCMPAIPCATRWFTVHESIGWVLMGCFICSLFPRAFVRAWPPRARAAPAAAAAPDPYDSDEHPQDMFQVKLGKRMTRSRRNLANAMWELSLAFSLTLLLGLQHVMGNLMFQSAFTVPHFMHSLVVSSVNATMSALCRLLMSDSGDPFGPWCALHMVRASTEDRSTQSWLRYQRKEMLRVCGTAL